MITRALEFAIIGIVTVLAAGMIIDATLRKRVVPFYVSYLSRVANTSSAALTVAAISSAPWAAETNPAS